MRVLGEWDTSDEAAVLIRNRTGEPLLWINRRLATGRLATWLILWGRRQLRDGAAFSTVSRQEIAVLATRGISTGG